MGNFDEIVKQAESKVLENLERKGFDIGVSEMSDLQRTAEWFEQRRGRFTGSGGKKLMGTSISTAKMEWGRAEKLIDFSEASKKYIYEKAMERKAGYVAEIVDNMNFKYGRKVESVIVKKFKDKKVGSFEFQDVGFIPVKGLEHCLGSSPDGNCLGIFKFNGINYGFEGKASMTWGTFYDRTEIAVDEKGIDFWQLQIEMMSLMVDKLFYVTAMPPRNIFEVLNCNDDDELNDLIKGIGIVEVDASPIHQKAMKQRALIGDAAIKKFLNGVNFHEAIRQAASEFEIE